MKTTFVPVQHDNRHDHVVREHLKLWLNCCFSGWVWDCGTQWMFTIQKISLRSLCSASLVHYRAVNTPTGSLFTPLSFPATSHFYIIHKTTFIVLFWHLCSQFGFSFHVEISTEISSFLLYTMNVRGKFNLWCSQDLCDWDNPQNTLSTFFFYWIYFMQKSLRKPACISFPWNLSEQSVPVKSRL